MTAITQDKSRLRVLVAGCALQLFLGILYVWSVFVMPVSQVYAWDAASVKLTSSFMISFFVLGILVGGNLQQKLGAQKVVLMGGLMLAAGMLVTAILPAGAAFLMYVTYGVIGGFGVGAAYNAIITAAQKWFPERRGFATGVSVCAFGFSTVVFAPLIEALIGQFGLRETFFILAAAFCAVVLALFSFIRLPSEAEAAGAQAAGKAAGTQAAGAQAAGKAAPVTVKSTGAQAAGKAAPSAAPQAGKQYTMLETIKTKQFYFITLSLMLGTAAFFILNPSFKTMAAERGLDASLGTAVVMLTGVANALGRLGAPLLSDMIGREKADVVIILTTSACALLLSFASGFLFIIAVALIAFCYGGFSGMYPVLTADYFGIKNVGSNYGAVMVGFAVSALTFPMLIGLVENVTAKFIILAALAAIGAALVILLIQSKKKGGAVE